MQSKKLQLAVIGCGAIFENNHLPALINSKIWQLAFLVDNDHKRIKQFAAKSNCGFSVNVKDIPSNIDACLIATPNYLHAQQSIDLLERGYHVICEKPMALNLCEAESVLQSAKNSNKHYFIVHQKRFQQNVLYLKKHFMANDIVKAIDISLGNKFGWVSRTFFYDSPQKAGGGALLDLGVHLIDLLLSLWDTIEINESFFSTTFKTNPIIDTGATCIGTINKNIPLTLRVSRITTLSNSIKIKYLSHEIELSLNDPNQISIKMNSDCNCKRIDFEITDEKDSFAIYWENVADVIFENNPIANPSKIQDGIEVMRCIESATEIGEIIIS